MGLLYREEDSCLAGFMLALESVDVGWKADEAVVAANDPGNGTALESAVGIYIVDTSSA